MRQRSASPLSRPINVERLTRDCAEVTVEASPDECAALARDYGLVAVRDLVGRFRLSGSLARLTVEGSVDAAVTQTCGVSLEPFEARVREPVEVVFTDSAVVPGEEDLDLPDPIENGRIDFGALTAEFLALGLDPYPRKPGIAFEPPPEDESLKPLAVLRRLRPNEPEG